jgi:ketosteroid isomerase-like protein
MNHRTSLLAGAALGLGARALLPKALMVKFRRDVAKLNAGDYAPLLASYADDAVLHFNDADHRWRGEHRGTAELDLFFRDFVAAKVQGEIKQLWIAGPPWALTMIVRFDDHAHAPDGRQLYDNRTTLVLRTRWGKVVEQWDYYEDTVRMVAFDRALSEIGVEPVGRRAA